MGKLVLNYAASLGMHPLHKMRSHCSLFEEPGHAVLFIFIFFCFVMKKLKLLGGSLHEM
jgi:hypothetical protein